MWAWVGREEGEEGAEGKERLLWFRGCADLSSKLWIARGVWAVNGLLARVDRGLMWSGGNKAMMLRMLRRVVALGRGVWFKI